MMSMCDCNQGRLPCTCKPEIKISTGHLDAPACKACNGLGHVPDGEIAGSGGVEFENGPVECVKDCPACKPAAQQQATAGNPVLAYADSYRDMARQGVEQVSVWSVITDLERNIAPLYAAPLQTERTNTSGKAHCPYCGICHTSNETCIQAVLRVMNLTQPAPVAVALPDRDRLRDIIAQAVGGDTYDCVRIWSAWGGGTMTEDDFVPVVDQEERLYEIADACLDELKRLNDKPTCCGSCPSGCIIGA